MTTSNLIYLPQEAKHSQAVLERFLPRLPDGAATRWLETNLPEKGQWIIDPFGASPQLALEAAQAGYRVLVISNNPITRFLLKMTATPPTVEDMQAALADLATAKRGSERMEHHIRELFTTRCDQCGATVDARAFLWQRDALTPYARIYSCPQCHQSGEFPTTDEDIEKASRLSQSGPHRARALERVAASRDPNRFHAEEALDAYLPRAVYALISMINKLDGIDLEAREGIYLRALLLAACDRGNNLWRVPKENFRPRQLTTPPRFMEYNLWLAVEEAIPLWANNRPATPLTFWPEPPPESGGICLYQGQIRDLTKQLDRLPVKAILTALPRPNQAYWTLSALWSGWLWGREAIGPFAKVLKRRRYDWSWHTAALYSALRRVADLLPPDTPFFGMVTENEAGFDAAAMVAADLSGFILDGTALRLKEGQTQMQWHKAVDRPVPPEGLSVSASSDAVRAILAERGEPTAYLHLQAGVLQTLSQQNSLAPTGRDPTINFSTHAYNVYNQARQLLLEILSPSGPFVRYQGGKSSIEIGKWWSNAPLTAAQPLADRVEMALVKLYQENHLLSWDKINIDLCNMFPGLQTPDIPLIQTILQSYTEQIEPGFWQLRSNDTTVSRREDIAEIYAILAETGEELGFSVRRDQPLVWEQALNGNPLHFYLIASAILGKIIDGADHPPEQGIIVLPGSRSGLVMHKRERDPRLNFRLDGGWRFLKFRHVRRLVENEHLSRENLASFFALDPLSHDLAQLPLL
jgi:hypothetical protein